jgi:hypothetical protein
MVLFFSRSAVEEDAPVVVETMLDVGSLHPELLEDWDTWGIDDSVERMTQHSDRDCQVKAGLLRNLLSCIKAHRDVSSSLNPTILLYCARPLFISGSEYACTPGHTPHLPSFQYLLLHLRNVSLLL